MNLLALLSSLLLLDRSLAMLSMLSAFSDQKVTYPKNDVNQFLEVLGKLWAEEDVQDESKVFISQHFEHFGEFGIPVKKYGDFIIRTLISFMNRTVKSKNNLEFISPCLAVIRSILTDPYFNPTKACNKLIFSTIQNILFDAPKQPDEEYPYTEHHSEILELLLVLIKIAPEEILPKFATRDGMVWNIMNVTVADKDVLFQIYHILLENEEVKYRVVMSLLGNKIFEDTVIPMLFSDEPIDQFRALDLCMLIFYVQPDARVNFLNAFGAIDKVIAMMSTPNVGIASVAFGIVKGFLKTQCSTDLIACNIIQHLFDYLAFNVAYPLGNYNANLKDRTAFAILRCIKRLYKMYPGEVAEFVLNELEYSTMGNFIRDRKILQLSVDLGIISAETKGDYIQHILRGNFPSDRYSTGSQQCHPSSVLGALTLHKYIGATALFLQDCLKFADPSSSSSSSMEVVEEEVKNSGISSSISNNNNTITPGFIYPPTNSVFGGNPYSNSVPSSQSNFGSLPYTPNYTAPQNTPQYPPRFNTTSNAPSASFLCHFIPTSRPSRDED